MNAAGQSSWRLPAVASKVLDVAHGWLDCCGISLAGMLDYCPCCHAVGHLRVLHKVLSLWYASNLMLRCSSSRALLEHFPNALVTYVTHHQS